MDSPCRHNICFPVGKKWEKNLYAFFILEPVIQPRKVWLYLFGQNYIV